MVWWMAALKDKLMDLLMAAAKVAATGVTMVDCWVSTKAVNLDLRMDLHLAETTATQ